jgi:serine/threonine protein kinase
LIELSRHVFELLRRDDDSILSRGRNHEDSSHVLVLAPVKEEAGPENLKRLEHEYSLRADLDPAWAARPIGITFRWDRPVLVLEDPGGIPLDQLLGQGSDLGSTLRRAISLATAIGQLHQCGIVHKDIKPANVLVDPATGKAWLMGIWDRFAAAKRAPTSRRPRIHCGDTSLHGTRTDRTDESFHRLPQRPLLLWSYALRNANGLTSVQRL